MSNEQNNQSDWSILFYITQGVLQKNPDDEASVNGYVGINDTHPLFGKSIEEVEAALNKTIFFVGDMLSFMSDVTGFYWIGFHGTDQETTNADVYALALQLGAMYL